MPNFLAIYGSGEFTVSIAIKMQELYWLFATCSLLLVYTWTCKHSPHTFCSCAPQKPRDNETDIKVVACKNKLVVTGELHLYQVLLMLWAAIVHLNFSRIFCSVWTEYTRRSWPVARPGVAAVEEMMSVQMCAGAGGCRWQMESCQFYLWQWCQPWPPPATAVTLLTTAGNTK